MVNVCYASAEIKRSQTLATMEEQYYGGVQWALGIINVIYGLGTCSEL